jgi:small conductance mechanosensitive channel
MDAQALDYINNALATLGAFGANLAGAITLLVVGWSAAAWAQRGVRRLLNRYDRFDATLKPLLASIVRYAILVFVIVAVLAQFGVQTTSIIAALGAAGLAIGLALQGTLANIAAGVMLLFLRPFKVEETIEAEGIAGTVLEIGLFTTVLKSGDGVYVSVPNTQIWARQIKNFSRLPTRRVDLALGLGHRADVDRAISSLTDVMTGDVRVLADPPPEAVVTGLSETAVTVALRCWVPGGEFGSVGSDLLRKAKAKLERDGIALAERPREVHVIEAPARG